MPSPQSLAAVIALVPALAAGFLVQRPTAESPEQPPRDVRAIWQRDCAVCHGAEGRGTSQGPDLAGAGRADLDYVLRTGRMPIAQPDDEIHRQPPAYDDATIDALVDYAAGLDEGLVGAGPDIPDVDADSGDVVEGGEIWRLQCTACHRWSGDGGAVPDDIAPDVRPADPRVLGEAVRAGPFAMPSFGRAALDDGDLDDLAAYVEDEVRHPDDSGGWSIGHIGPVAEGAAAFVLGLGALLLVSRALGTRESPHK